MGQEAVFAPLTGGSPLWAAGRMPELRTQGFQKPSIKEYTSNHIRIDNIGININILGPPYMAINYRIVLLLSFKVHSSTKSCWRP